MQLKPLGLFMVPEHNMNHKQATGPLGPSTALHAAEFPAQLSALVDLNQRSF